MELLPRLTPTLNDLGVDYLGERLGGCRRALWYGLGQVTETNPEKNSHILCRHIDALIKDSFIKRLSSRVKVDKDVRWTLPTERGTVHAAFDAVYQDKDQKVGLFIHCGSGYGFSWEVFGGKGREGHIKDGHLIEAWAALSVCPMTVNRVETIYIDRGMPDRMVCYTTTASQVSRTEFLQELILASGPTIPERSYEIVWISREKVAKLYANKKISKDLYETWMESGIGGDWQCQYCPYLERCKDE